jgi:5-methylcytosine-specific restriction endonuclease McrA
MSQHSHLYNDRRWRARRVSQLKTFPLCKYCHAAGRITLATIADHVDPHKGDLKLFWYGPLQSLCKQCHDSRKQKEENKTYVVEIGLDGWPKNNV